MQRSPAVSSASRPHNDLAFSSTRDSQAVLDSVRRIVHALELGSRAAQKTLGLSAAQLFVLQTLAAGDDAMSINELAARTYTHQSSVSVVVSRLVERKLVRRTASLIDGRRLQLTVTAAGRRLLRSKFVTPQGRLCAALDRLPAAQLVTLRVLLERVVSLSQMDTETPPMFFESPRPKENAPSARVAKKSRSSSQ